MPLIHFICGDATQPIGTGNKILVHICNDVGGWGKGFVLALSRRWKEPEQQYRLWYQSQENFQLGEVQFVQVEPDLWVANMIGQRHIIYDEQGNPPIRYEAVAAALATVGAKAVELHATVHMPRIGCGLAGGKWEHIEPLIQEALTVNGIETTVYDFG